MQQRVEVALGAEVPGVHPQQVEVGAEQAPEHPRPGGELAAGHRAEERGQGQHEDQHEGQGREQAPDAPQVERGQPDRPGAVPLRHQHPGDHEPGHDEEHVHAHEAAREAEPGVVQHDHRDGHGPQALDVRPVRRRPVLAVEEPAGRCGRGRHRREVPPGRVMASPWRARRTCHPEPAADARAASHTAREGLADRVRGEQRSGPLVGPIPELHPPRRVVPEPGERPGQGPRVIGGQQDPGVVQGPADGGEVAADHGAPRQHGVDQLGRELAPPVDGVVGDDRDDVARGHDLPPLLQARLADPALPLAGVGRRVRRQRQLRARDGGDGVAQGGDALVGPDGADEAHPQRRTGRDGPAGRHDAGMGQDDPVAVPRGHAGVGDRDVVLAPPRRRRRRWPGKRTSPPASPSLARRRRVLARSRRSSP